MTAIKMMRQVMKKLIISLELQKERQKMGCECKHIICPLSLILCGWRRKVNKETKERRSILRGGQEEKSESRREKKKKEEGSLPDKI